VPCPRQKAKGKSKKVKVKKRKGREGERRGIDGRRKEERYVGAAPRGRPVKIPNHKFQCYKQIPSSKFQYSKQGQKIFF